MKVKLTTRAGVFPSSYDSTESVDRPFLGLFFRVTLSGTWGAGNLHGSDLQSRNRKIRIDMNEYLVHFERDHPEGPPGIESKGQLPVEAESSEAARTKFFEEFSSDVGDQFSVIRVEKR